MPKSVVEELQLNTKEGRKRFYEQLAAHKNELLDSYHVKLPDYEQWEKECETKMALAKEARKHNEKQLEVLEKYKPGKTDRIFPHLLQLDGEDAEQNNSDLQDMLLNNRKGFADLVAKKLLAIDTKKEQENMRGKSDLELAEMYLKTPEKYDLAWVVTDLLNDYGDVLDEDLKQKVKEKKSDLLELYAYGASTKPLEEELYNFLPLPEIESLDQFKNYSINFDFGKNEQIKTDVNNFFVHAGMTTLKKLMDCDNAYKKSVDEKIDDLLAACKDSEDKSAAQSKQYQTMKKALDDFKKNYKKDSKTAEKAKENLKKAANGYLTYKVDKPMNQKSHGAIAAAGGILELVDEIDAHKPLDENDIKPFIKHSEAEGIYEQKATEALGKGKDELRAFNEFMKNGAMKENLNKIIGAIEESGNSSHRDSDLSGEMYKQLIAIRNKNAEGTDITYDEMLDLKKTAAEYLSYKNQKGYNKNALGKIAAADGILSFVNAFENKDASLVKEISTEKNAVDRIMEAVKEDKSIAPVYRAKKEKVSYTDLLKNEMKANSKKENKKEAVVPNVAEQEKKEAVVEKVVEQEKKEAVGENIVEQEKAREEVKEEEKKEEKQVEEKKEPEKKEEAEKPAEIDQVKAAAIYRKLPSKFKDDEEFIALQKKVKNTIKYTSDEFDDAFTFSGRQNYFAGYVSLKNLEKRLDKAVNKDYSILDLNEMDKAYEDTIAGKAVGPLINSIPFQRVIQNNPFDNMDEKLKPIEELYDDYSAEVSKGKAKANNKGKEENKEANKDKEASK